MFKIVCNGEKLYFWMHMHPYTYLCPPARLSACPFAHLPACPSQLASIKDDIHAHPLRPMSYWFSPTLEIHGCVCNIVTVHVMKFECV